MTNVDERTHDMTAAANDLFIDTGSEDSDIRLLLDDGHPLRASTPRLEPSVVEPTEPSVATTNVTNDVVVTRNDNVVTRNDNVVTRNDDVVTRNDDVVTRNDDVVTRNDDVVTRNDDVVTHDGRRPVVGAKDPDDEDDQDDDCAKAARSAEERTLVRLHRRIRVAEAKCEARLLEIMALEYLLGMVPTDEPSYAREDLKALVRALDDDGASDS
jgi:hypothetical protein